MSCCKTYDPCLDGKLNQIGSYSAAARYAAEQSANSATQSANSATASATSASNAATSATQANNYLTQVENIFEDFDERYLGSKAVAPTVDNQGNPLQEGAMYWNSVANSLYVWDGSVWVALPTGFNELTNFLATGTTTARNLVTRTADVVNVKDFGAIGDGVADDTNAIQAAVNTGKNVYFPSGKYIITNTITCSTRGQGFYGDAGSLGGKDGIPTSDHGSIIELSNFTVGATMFLVTESQNTFSNLKFKGDAISTTDIGLKFEKITNTDDADGYVYDCEFHKIFQPIYFYGRALHADRNVFSELNGGDSITLDWPSSGTSGGQMQNDPLYMGRAQRITNNRFHGGRYAIAIKNYTLRGPIFSNNVVDIGQGFIEVGTGGTQAGLNGAIIDGNIADLCAQVPISFRANSQLTDVVISNNKLGGAIAGTVDGNDHRPFSAIRFLGADSINNFLISGNTITGTDAGAINIISDVGAPTTTVNNFAIQSNIIRETGLDGNPNRFVFFSEFDINEFLFSNNIISSLGATTISIIRSSSKTFTSNIVKNNIWPQATPLFTTTTLSNPIDIEHRQGGYIVNTAGAFSIGEHGAYNGSLPLILNRTSSASGVGTRYKNSSGDIDIFATPTGAGAGEFTPGSDNLVDLGSAALSWKDLFYDGAVNPSDDRLKTYLTIEDAEKAAALEIKANIRKFKFNSAIAKKGDGSRIHWGVSAQQVADIMRSHGLDPDRYSFYCYDEWDEIPEEVDSDGNVIREKVPAGNKYGIKYTELIAFILGAI